MGKENGREMDDGREGKEDNDVMADEGTEQTGRQDILKGRETLRE